MVCRHIQRTRCPFNQRYATAAANGEATADGNLVIVQMSYQHLLHAAVLQVVFDGVERAKNNTFDPFEVLLQAEHVEQAVDAVQRLFDLFYKKNNVLFRRQTELRACYGTIARQVATDEDTLGMANPVILITPAPTTS